MNPAALAVLLGLLALLTRAKDEQPASPDPVPTPDVKPSSDRASKAKVRKLEAEIAKLTERLEKADALAVSDRDDLIAKLENAQTRIASLETPPAPPEPEPEPEPEPDPQPE